VLCERWVGIVNDELAVRLRVEMALRDRRATDVAKVAGVTLPTLSRIIHGHQRPSEALRRRIESAIRQEEPVSRE
jgi:transcriptional regulator with XRE-family HTH domain